MRYSELNEMLIGNRVQKRIANNTVAHRLNPKAIAIRLHGTDILTFLRKPEKVIVSTGGWKTCTTKDRLNKYLPGHWSITQRNSEWYWTGKTASVIPVPFTDGDYIVRDPNCLDGEGWPQWRLKAQAFTTTGKEKAERSARIRKDIAKYALACGNAIPMQLPSGGDCWLCLMRDVKTGVPLGEVSKDSEHLFSHMREKYVVPSLVHRAMEHANVGPLWYDIVFRPGDRKVFENMIDGARDIVRRAVRKYLSAQLGLVR